MPFDTWWRLCEGRWNKDVNAYLPYLTDLQFREFQKRYGTRHSYGDPRSLMSPKERGTTLAPGETKTFRVTVREEQSHE